MARSSATTVEAYLAELPADRRAELEPVLAMVRKALPKGYAETMGWGMISWGIPLSVYPDTYNKQPLCYAALAAQKNYHTLYLMAVYADSAEERALREAFAAAGKKLDMGKCCVRFKRVADLDLPALKRAVAAIPPTQFIAMYEVTRKKK